jgi:hypothetical protein
MPASASATAAKPPPLPEPTTTTSNACGVAALTAGAFASPRRVGVFRVAGQRGAIAGDTLSNGGAQ